MTVERRAKPLVSRSADARPRILAYHAVGTPSWGVNDCAPATFRRHLELALDTGRRFVPATEIWRDGGRLGDLAMTFDDGVASVVSNAGPILLELGIPWTVFVTTAYADGLGPWPKGTTATWRELERVASLGGTIGSHAMTHRNFASLTHDETTHEIFGSMERIKSALGITVTEFAIPFGRSSDWNAHAQSEALRAGYEVVYAYTENRRFPGTVGRTAVTRFDGERGFAALLGGAFDDWQEWF